MWQLGQQQLISQLLQHEALIETYASTNNELTSKLADMEAEYQEISTENARLQETHIDTRKQLKFC